MYSYRLRLINSLNFHITLKIYVYCTVCCTTIIIAMICICRLRTLELWHDPFCFLQLNIPWLVINDCWELTNNRTLLALKLQSHVILFLFFYYTNNSNGRVKVTCTRTTYIFLFYINCCWERIIFLKKLLSNATYRNSKI